MPATRTEKWQAWLRLVRSHPREAFDRVLSVADVRSDRLFRAAPSYRPVPVDQVLAALDERFGGRARNFRSELEQTERELAESISEQRAISPIGQQHNGDVALARLCYVTCRLARPSVVVETGVAQGVTSRFILSALEANGTGHLESIDLPPLGRDVDRFVGCLVPESLRHRWTLHRGVSRRVLPDLLPHLGQMVDVFVHDSLHTFRNISLELRLLTPFLSPTGTVIVDDIDENAAFEQWVRDSRPDYHAVVREEQKERFFGFAVLA